MICSMELLLLGSSLCLLGHCRCLVVAIECLLQDYWVHTAACEKTVIVEVDGGGGGGGKGGHTVPASSNRFVL